MWVRVALGLAAIGGFACTGGGSHARAGSVSPADVTRWAGAPRDSLRSEDDASTIRFSDGEKLVRLLGWSETSGSAEHERCALYGLRVIAGNLEEGRITAPCPERRSPGETMSSIDFGVPEPGRSTRLRAALDGAAVVPLRAGVGSVSVWLETDRGVVQGRVPHPHWPPPYGEAGAVVRDRAPADLAEVWEAVMYPARYASRSTASTSFSAMRPGVRSAGSVAVTARHGALPHGNQSPIR